MSTVKKHVVKSGLVKEILSGTSVEQLVDYVKTAVELLHQQQLQLLQLLNVLLKIAKMSIVIGIVIGLELVKMMAIDLFVKTHAARAKLVEDVMMSTVIKHVIKVIHVQINFSSRSVVLHASYVNKYQNEILNKYKSTGSV